MAEMADQAEYLEYPEPHRCVDPEIPKRYTWSFKLAYRVRFRHDVFTK